MPLLARAGAAALGTLLLVACGSSPSAASLDSGVKGQVVLSPTCPVERPGQRCQRGYQAKIAVFTLAHHREVMKFRSGPDGNFRVRLAPGRYILKGTSKGLPRPVPTTVTVRAHRYARVTVMFDTGIR